MCFARTSCQGMCQPLGVVSLVLAALDETRSASAHENIAGAGFELVGQARARCGGERGALPHLARKRRRAGRAEAPGGKAGVRSRWRNPAHKVDARQLLPTRARRGERWILALGSARRSARGPRAQAGSSAGWQPGARLMEAESLIPGHPSRAQRRGVRHGLASLRSPLGERPSPRSPSEGPQHG